MKLNSLKDTQKLAKKLSKIIKERDVIFLYGEIGSGKTTFVRFLINGLETRHRIKKSEILSPTFNIVSPVETLFLILLDSFSKFFIDEIFIFLPI